MSSCESEALQKWRASTSTSGYSVRQSEEMIKSLRKENFNLKLKMFLIECKLGKSVVKPEMNELCDREFVDLFLENQTMKSELSENQKLLMVALTAIENLEAQNSKNQLQIKAFNAKQKIPQLKTIKPVSKLDES